MTDVDGRELSFPNSEAAMSIRWSCRITVVGHYADREKKKKHKHEARHGYKLCVSCCVCACHLGREVSKRE
jgi:hypothetical protein